MNNPLEQLIEWMERKLKECEPFSQTIPFITSPIKTQPNER